MIDTVELDKIIENIILIVKGVNKINRAVKKRRVFLEEFDITSDFSMEIRDFTISISNQGYVLKNDKGDISLKVTKRGFFQEKIYFSTSPMGMSFFPKGDQQYINCVYVPEFSMTVDQDETKVES